MISLSPSPDLKTMAREIIQNAGCGANSPGGGGFQPGNKCAVGSGRGGKKRGAKATAKKSSAKKATKKAAKKSVKKAVTKAAKKSSKPLSDEEEYSKVYDQRKQEKAEAFKSVKKMLPAGTTETKGWSKKGGHAGAKTLSNVGKKLKAAGFTTDHSLHGSPDGSTMGSGTTYTHPKTGVQVHLSSSYGATSSSNRFSISVHAPPSKASAYLGAASKLQQAQTDIKFHKWDMEDRKKYKVPQTRGSEGRKYQARKLMKARKQITESQKIISAFRASQ